MNYEKITLRVSLLLSLLLPGCEKQSGGPAAPRQTEQMKYGHGELQSVNDRPGLFSVKSYTMTFPAFEFSNPHTYHWKVRNLPPTPGMKAHVEILVANAAEPKLREAKDKVVLKITDPSDVTCYTAEAPLKKWSYAISGGGAHRRCRAYVLEAGDFCFETGKEYQIELIWPGVAEAVESGRVIVNATYGGK